MTFNWRESYNYHQVL